MPLVDWIVLALFLVVTLAIGLRMRGKVDRIEAYFLGNRQVPAWLALLSVVATETSAVTFLSVPAEGLKGNLTFLQLPLGYLVGRTAIAWLVLPGLMDQRYLTLYQAIRSRFGPALQRLTSLLFVLTRTAADGLRLFLTALVVGRLLGVPLDIAIVVTTAVTVGYAFLGGIRAVLWTDALQLIVYVTGALIALGIMVGHSGGWGELIHAAAQAGKLQVLDFSWDLSQPYTFWAGVIGGAFLSAATHGADQLMVQRYLCTGSLRRARMVLVGSGIIVLVQFALFLWIGIGLWHFYGQAASGSQLRADEVFIRFILEELPIGVRGVVVAAALAAAMSTLSSSINSVASSVIGDLFQLGDKPSAESLRWSRWATVAAGAAQGLIAILAIHLVPKDSPVIRPILGIASITTGVVLGLLILSHMPRCKTTAAVVAWTAGFVVTLAVQQLTNLAYPWYSVVGVTITVVVGWVAGRLTE